MAAAATMSESGMSVEDGQGGADRAEVAIRPPVLLLVAVAVGYGVDLFYPLPFLSPGFPALWVGVGVWSAGVVLAVIAIIELDRAGTGVDTHTPTQAIVETGIYRYSRNPIYLGAHLGLVGVAVAFDSLWLLATLVPFYAVIRYGVVAREESYLEAKFGDSYRGYKARVRRWM